MSLFANTQTLILKIGSSLLVEQASGEVHTRWLATLAKDIALLKQRNIQVVIVSSGAVALGRKTLGLVSTALELQEKQAAAACGQSVLMHAWSEALDVHQLSVAQILLTPEDSQHRRRYLNASGTLHTLLEAGIIPIVNENDTVARTELKFGDNDRLAARVAQMVSAETLVLLSDVDGLYTANPTTQPHAEFIDRVESITPEIWEMAGSAASSVGTGGMVTKLEAAEIALSAGCSVIIGRGNVEHPLQQMERTHRFTQFIAQENPRTAKQQWIAGSLHPAGEVQIDDGAAVALATGNSLLAAGVTRISGNFERGDTVKVVDSAGKTLGIGLISYPHYEAEQIIGKKSKEIETILGYIGNSALIHRNDMVLH